ncbi:DUF99 family protein [Aetokthonos hydrillicola Thurmond2011]|jgi:hypothetical protein|uniref:DUF99 family protein n=1 Tax=Aetokthonos hydrillicola Thurmond2011 TaxID=2712845 RepID=A0AAP5I2C8_9CYAN|nr:DUF99 family protein [Aetokthonos hydrillicola]MBO3463775.1 DUF99 family protein [Aetokthonos hydrillicola CCALA 1050]MBW4585930.1 DUF99 family protein [Aetokthonos hydrillicola CCALA 1050]MDR9893843.1 DUF99 family protein [Aetokthonos hydrillicola Thurmond2011]
MKLESLLRLNRTIRVIGFDDAPFIRGVGGKVSIAGVVCGGTRFEGMVWGNVEVDGLDATDAICRLLIGGKFLSQLHIVLIDGLGFGGFNLVNLPELAQRLQLPCVAIMRRFPDLVAVREAMKNLPNFEQRLELLKLAGTIYETPPFVFQVSGEEPEVIAGVLQRLTDCGKVPEALRLAHLITAAVILGESGSSA